MPFPRNRRIRVGLLGGSFNPAHQGHRYISVEALKHLDLHEIWWLVSPQNPLKPVEGMYPFETRVAIAKQVASHPKIKVSTLEKTFKTQYTYDTLLKMKELYKDIHFIWLMGSDNLAQLPQWYRWHDIVKSMPIVVFSRGNDSLRSLSGKMAHSYSKFRVNGACLGNITTKYPPVWAFLHLRKHPASATALRKNTGKQALKKV